MVLGPCDASPGSLGLGRTVGLLSLTKQQAPMPPAEPDGHPNSCAQRTPSGCYHLPAGTVTLWNHSWGHPIGFIPRSGSLPRNVVPQRETTGPLVYSHQLQVVAPRLLSKCQAARCQRQVEPAACPGSWLSSSSHLVVPGPGTTTCSECREELWAHYLAGKPS